MPAQPESRPSAVDRYNAFVLRHARRNLTLNALDGILYVTGVALVSRQTVLPGFIHECVTRVDGLAAWENRIVGLLGVLMAVSFVLPHQVITAKIVEARRLVKPVLLVLASFERVVWFFAGMAALLLGASNPRAALYVFLACMFLYPFFIGLVNPAWRELMAKTTPVNRRGLLFGLRDFAGGAAGALALLAATRVLSSEVFAFPRNYAILFFGMFTFGMLSMIPISRLREAPYPAARHARPLREAFRRMRLSLREDSMLWRYLICRWTLELTMIANASFFATKALRGGTPEGTLAMTLKFAMAGALARMVWAFIGAQMADRFGFRSVFAASSILKAAAILAALFADAPLYFYAAFFLAVWSQRAMITSRTNYILELAPPGRRPSYVALDNMSRVPLVVAPLVGGWLADAFGYTLPFAAGALMALVAAALFIFVAPEPRRDRPLETVS